MRSPGTALSGGTLATGGRPARVVRLLVNLSGAVCAAYFARASLSYYLATHRLIGGLFFVEQAWFVLVFLIRRPARSAGPHEGASAGLTGTLAPWMLRRAGHLAGCCSGLLARTRSGASTLGSRCS